MRRLLRDVVCEQLRDAIVFGVYPPDAPLREAELALDLQVSKAPVREALAVLVQEGLVIRKAQSHTKVAPLDTRQTRDALTVVRLLHAEAAREARVTASDITRMRAANDRFRAATRAHDVRTALAADDELHRVVVDAAGNAPLAETIERWTPMIRRLEVARFSGAHGEESATRHEEFIAACAAGDRERAASIVSAMYGSLLEEAGDQDASALS